MAKPLTLLKARPLIGSLFRRDKLTLVKKGSICAVYFNEESETRFFAETWEEILEEAQMERFKQTQQTL